MKRRWRRLVLIAGTILLTACLIVVGLAVWLYKSGRLATLSETLLQRLSGQDVSLETIEFPAWNTVAFTHVRLQHRLPGWQLIVKCPRLEAHYGLTGLLNKRVDHLSLLQPDITLTRRADTSLPPQSVPAANDQPVVALPVKRIIVHQARLQAGFGGQVHTLQQLDAILRAQNHRHLQAEINGYLQDHTGTFQIVADLPLDKPQPAGRLQIIGKTVPVALLTEIVAQRLPSDWNVVLQGALDLTADLNLQDGVVQGSVTTTAGQVLARAQGMTLSQATFASETDLRADLVQRHLHLAGKAQLHAARAGNGSGLTLSTLFLSTETTITADLVQQSVSLQGRASLQAKQAQNASDITIADVSLSTTATLQASYAQQPTMRLEGHARLQAKQVRQTPDTTLTNASLSTPWRLSRTSAGWRFTATPDVVSDRARFGTLAHASGLVFKTAAPLQLDYAEHGFRVQATPEVTVETLLLLPAAEGETALRVTGLRAHLPLQGSPTMIDMTDFRVNTQTWYRPATDQTAFLEAISLQGSGGIDLRRQRLAVREITAELPQLGSIRGSGIWHWPSHTVHDLRMRAVPSTVETLKQKLQAWIPVAYRGWHLGGQTELHLHTARLSLQPPQRVQHLAISWQLRNGAFNSPDSVYAGENLHGTLLATLSFDAAAQHMSLQGTLTLQPFALLVGNLFPAIEENRITSVFTFLGVYDGAAERLQIYLAGQFHELGTVTLKGQVYRPMHMPELDLQLHLGNLQADRLWKTVVSDPVRFPVLSRTNVKGRLDAALHLRGQPTRGVLQGTLHIMDGDLHSETAILKGVSLFLPLQIHYPLPDFVPPTTAPAPEAFGQFEVDTLQIGNIELGRLRLRLMLQSDTVLFHREIIVPLWGGQVALQPITVQNLLRPHRHIALRARLHHLDLQRIPRGSTKLPLAGIVNGDFPLLRIRGDRLDTQGSLTIDIAGGMIRLSGIQGLNLFSALPTLRCSLITEQPISLLRLTEIYPIGDIGGTVRFSVSDLVITAGEPAAFSLEFDVQEKHGEPRQITLRALNNLLFTTGSAKVASNLLGDTQRLPYKRFGIEAILRNDTLRLRGKYHDSKGVEYFMQAPALGSGVSIVNRTPENGIAFRDFLQRLKATVLEKPSVQVK